MKILGRILVGLLAVVGALAIMATVIVVLAVRSHGPVDLGAGHPTPAPSATGDAGGRGGLVADHLKADVTVPFATVQQHARQGVQLSDGGGGRIRVATPTQAMGRTWQVTAEGDMSIDGGDVVVNPSHVNVDGLGVLDGVISAVARQAVSVRVPITGLPQGVHVTRVTSTSQGLRVSVEGDEVPLPAR